jgi:uncharacterized protein YdhG (YjbR/CyaY superfamily)
MQPWLARRAAPKGIHGMRNTLGPPRPLPAAPQTNSNIPWRVARVSTPNARSRVEARMSQRGKRAASEPETLGPPPDRADGESAVLANIAGMPGPDRAIGERVHAIIKANAPSLSPRLWYGMPAYARDGKVVCFFQSAQKFKTRYATFGFMHEANLDDGPMWPTAFALKELTDTQEERIAALVRKGGELTTAA